MFVKFLQPASYVIAISLSLSASRSVASDPANAVTVNPDKPGRLSISAGAVTRSVHADFHMNAPGPLNLSRFYTRRGPSGLGEFGLATGPRDVVKYPDGSVGPDTLFLFTGGTDTVGTTSFSVSSLDQVTYRTASSTGGAPFTPGEVRYSSDHTDYSYRETYASHGFDAVSNAHDTGPFVSLRFAAWEGKWCELGLSVAWSYFHTDHATGTHVLSHQTLTETRHDTQYRYLYDLFMTKEVGDISGFNKELSVDNFFEAGGYGIFYGPADFSSLLLGSALTRPFRNPSSSRSDRSSSQTLIDIVSIAHASLDLKFHEVAFPIDLTWRPCRWCRIGVSAGPTINVLDYDFKTNSQWFLNGSVKPFLARTLESSGQEIKPGFTLQGVVTLNLNRAGSLFLEVASGYAWVETLDLKIGGASTHVNVSSETGRVTLGCRF